jgi:hypothetical protein
MSDRQSVSMFGIETVEDYLSFCEEAVKVLSEDQASVLKGFTSVLALNHFPDWLQYKLSIEDRVALALSSTKPAEKVIDDFEKLNSDLKLVRSLANGFKHLRKIDRTGKIEGYGKGPYGIGPYGTSYLLVDLGEDKGASDRWVVGLDLCQRVLKWWEKTLFPILKNEGDEEIRQND